MDFEAGDSWRERHFVLHIMSFVYGISGRPLQYCLQQMLDEYPRENEKYCTKNITQALLLYISDYLDSNVTLVDLSSQAYQVQTKELLQMYAPYDFLKFLAYYALKSRFEYHEKNLLDSPMKFFSSMVRFLEEIKNNDRHSIDFWERLDEAAAKVVAKGLETIKSRNCESIDDSDDENRTSEREFVLMIMRSVSNLYRNPLPDYLKRELDEFMFMSRLDFDPKFDIAFNIEAENLERSIAFLGSDETIYDYYYLLSTKSFSAKHFLEFALCCTRKALLEYYIESNKQSPLRASNRLCLILQEAKEEGKFYSVDAFIEGAEEIIEDEKRKAEHKGIVSDASTEFFSDISTESTGPTSDRDNMFESFENSLPTIDSVNVVTNRKSDQPVFGSVVAPAKNTERDIKRIILPVQDAQPEIESAIVLGEDAYTIIENVIATGENPKLAIENSNATGEYTQPPATKNGIATDENAQPDIEKGIATSENSQPALEIVVASSKNGEAGESENLVASSEQATRKSCSCCTTL